MSVDKQLWNRDYPAEIILSEDSQWDNIIIDGTPVDGQYTFPCIDGDKTYQIEACAGEEKKLFSLKFTYLPVLRFRTGNFGLDYVEDEIVIQQDGRASAPMMAKVKWRGGTTNAEGKHKRNYKIKFIDEEGNKQEHTFWGLRKDNIWILDAGQVDLFRMRNLIASQIWQDFGSKPYYIGQEPTALTSSRGHMVEVFLNDQYQGVFNMCEPIDRKQMRLKKFENNGTIHGGLWKATGYGDATFWNIPDEYDNTREKNDVWELKYPEIEDLCPSDYSTLRNAIMFVASSADAEFNAHVSEYFDIPVLIDYYLFVQLTNGFDICGKNIYWAVYDKMNDKKLTPAMWDLDCTMGQNFEDSPLHPDYVSYDNPLLCPNNILYRLDHLNTNQFREKVKERYADLRQTTFATGALQQRYTDAYNMIADCGAAGREEQRWSFDTDISGLSLDLKTELEYICEWISKRTEFLDEQFSYSPAAIFPVENARPANGNAYTLQGTLAPQAYKGIVINRGRLEVRK